MSLQLLTRTKAHIIDVGNLLAAYSVKYYRWSDADLKGSASVALFRSPGTSGESDPVAQQNDVSLFLLTSPSLVTQADADMLAVQRYLRTDFESANVFSYVPLGGYSGPTYLDNGRAMFEMLIRCSTEDH